MGLAFSGDEPVGKTSSGTLDSLAANELSSQRVGLGEFTEVAVSSFNSISGRRVLRKHLHPSQRSGARDRFSGHSSSGKMKQHEDQFALSAFDDDNYAEA